MRNFWTALRRRSNDAYGWSAHYNVDRSYISDGLNRIMSAGSATFNHDARGNLTGDGVNGYSYNSVNQLMVHSGGGIINTLYYEPSSGMLSSVNANVGPNGLDTRFAWSGPELLLERSGTTGAILRRYVHGAGSDDPIAWYEGSGINSSTRRFLMADERGSVVSVTDSAGGTIAINAYDEYGIPAPTNVGRFGYTGQIWLPELKLWYYKARIYSPTLGRFLQTDPIGYKDGINWYAYVGGDPVNRVDPDGQIWGLIGKAVKLIRKGGDVTATVAGAVTDAKTIVSRNAKLGERGAAFVSLASEVLSPVSVRDGKAVIRATRVEKHHVVPKGDRRAAPARDNMTANGINPRTEPTNIVQLTGDKHDITKRDSYVQDTNARIESQPDAASIRSECCKIAENLSSTPVEELGQQYPKKNPK